MILSGFSKLDLKKQISEHCSKIIMPKRLPDMIYPVEVSYEECFYGCRKEIIVEKIYGNPENSESSLGTLGERELKKYTLDISSGVKDGAILKFEKEGCQPLPSSNDCPGDLVFKIKTCGALGFPSSSEIRGNPRITVEEYDVKVEIKVDILKILFGGSFTVKYFTEEFEISTSDFPDSIIEESKEYQLANLGVKKEDGTSGYPLGERGILILVIKYDYEESKKLTEKKKEKIKDILEN